MRRTWHLSESSKMMDGNRRQLVKSVVHACQVLSVFRTDSELLALSDITLRSGLPKTIAFRLLYTLRHVGLVEQVGRNLYRSRALLWRTRSLTSSHRTGKAQPQLNEESTSNSSANG